MREFCLGSPEVVARRHAEHEITVDHPLTLTFDSPVSSPAARMPGSADGRRRRVHSRVALHLLEALRSQDLPSEVLDDENLTITLPRRLGLSDVVDQQIRRYKDDARRRRRLTDAEIQDLIRLVIRRPDSRDVFLQVGADLHGRPAEPGWRRLLPRRLAHALARRRVRQRLRALFGRPLVHPAGSPFVLDAADDLLIRSDPGGDACEVVTGLARAELSRLGVGSDGLVHVTCRSRGDDRCRWALAADDTSA